MRVLITGGAKEIGRAFSEAVGEQGHQLFIAGRDGKALETAEAELRAKGDPDEQRISRWARSQCVQGRFTPVEQSAALLARIVSGEFDHLSGGLITPADR